MSDCFQGSGFVWSLCVDHIWIKLPNVFDRWEIAHLDPECPVFGSYNLITWAYYFSIFYRSIIKTPSFKDSNHRTVIIFFPIWFQRANSYGILSLNEENTIRLFLFLQNEALSCIRFKQLLWVHRSCGQSWELSRSSRPAGLPRRPGVQECLSEFSLGLAQPSGHLFFSSYCFSCLLLDVHQKQPVSTCAMWYFTLGETQASNRDEPSQSQTDSDRPVMTGGPRRLYSTKH